MISPKARDRNDRTSLRDWNQTVRAIRARTPVSATPGLEISGDAGGQVVSYTNPLRTRWVFVIGIDRNVVLCKECRPFAGYRAGWEVEEINLAIIRARPAPNYTVEHFAHFIIDGTQPSETDLACKLIGGYIVPDYRFKLVEPPDSTECAECT